MDWIRQLFAALKHDSEFMINEINYSNKSHEILFPFPRHKN